MATKKKSKKITKKQIKKIEISILIATVLVVLCVLLNNIVVSEEKALEIATKCYFESENVLGKVLGGTSWLELSDECIEKEGYKLCKSTLDNMQRYKDLEKYISKVCTKEYTKKLLENKELVYKNVDGDLYVFATNKNKDIFYAGLKEIRVIERSATEIKCKVICNYYVDIGSEEVYTMPFDYIVTKSFGQWKTNFFELPY